MPSIAELRREYSLHGLDEREVTADPMEQFGAWFDAARTAGVHEPNAMTLATTGDDGPNVRTVLLKEFDASGFVFFTNYASAKGRELARDPRAALLFLWHDLERQVRARGRVEKVPRQTSIAYFAQRPRGAQLGAWASRQSEPVESRAALERRLEELEREWHGKDVPPPPEWGGYRLRHDVVEFWQGRPNRLHDRIVYHREPSGSWRVQRLCP